MTALLVLALLAGAIDIQGAMLTLSGASCIEELSQESLEHFNSLSVHPVDINLAGRSRLLSSGLFSPYQVASLLQCRIRDGDILSFTELGLLDGFTPALAEALKYFVVLGGDSPPGKRRSSRLDQALTVNAGMRTGPQYSAGFKYEAILRDRTELYWTSRVTYSAPQWNLGTLSGAWYGRKHIGKLIAGHFQARFGQGLVQWSGFELSGLPSIAAFRKNPGGLSPTGSASAELCGLACEVEMGGSILSAAYSFAGHRAIANVTRTFRTATLSATVASDAASVDWRFSRPDWSFFGEAALRFDGASSALAGAMWVPRYGTRLALQSRWFDKAHLSQYSGASIGMETPWMTATLDAGYCVAKRVQRYKLMAVVNPVFDLGKLELQPLVRLGFRLAPDGDNPPRAEVRASMTAESAAWMMSARCDMVKGSTFGWLWYVEAGHKSDKLSVYIRGGIFKVDKWDCRIYVYERDAPGRFNVPAYYGRGLSASATAALKCGSRHSIYLRISTIQYPWNATPKAGRIEGSVQYALNL